MAAAVKGEGSAFEVGAVRPLFEVHRRLSGYSGLPGYNYDVSADGQRFLVNTATDRSAPVPMIVVTNWTADHSKVSHSASAFFLLSFHFSLALLERLGVEASAVFVELIDNSRREAVDEAVTEIADRYERFVEETSKIRIEMAQMRGEFRQERAQFSSNLRVELAAGRFDLLEWAFMFWVGQLVSVVGIVALLLRTL